jgi:hypothetical protein
MDEDGFAEPMNFEDPSESLLADMLDEVDSLDAWDEDDDKKERRRKIIKLIVGAVLSYHVIPQPFDAISLGQNSTHATNLTLPEGSLDGEPLRVRVGRAPFSPALSINLFSRVVGPEILTSNGIIHVISLPLLPPPAVFTGQFGVPSVFSIAVSSSPCIPCVFRADKIPIRRLLCSVWVSLTSWTITTFRLATMRTRARWLVPTQSPSLRHRTVLSNVSRSDSGSSCSRRSVTGLSRSCCSITSCHRMRSTLVCNHI